MKMLVVAFGLVALAVAAPADPADYPRIVKSVFEKLDTGYQYSFETENGINQLQNGELKQIVGEDNKPHDVVVVRGSYTYLNADGTEETVNYYADETGFHPEGKSIPKPDRR